MSRHSRREPSNRDLEWIQVRESGRSAGAPGGPVPGLQWCEETIRARVAAQDEPASAAVRPGAARRGLERQGKGIGGGDGGLADEDPDRRGRAAHRAGERGCPASRGPQGTGQDHPGLDRGSSPPRRILRAGPLRWAGQPGSGQPAAVSGRGAARGRGAGSQRTAARADTRPVLGHAEGGRHPPALVRLGLQESSRGAHAAGGTVPEEG